MRPSTPPLAWRPVHARLLRGAAPVEWAGAAIGTRRSMMVGVAVRDASSMVASSFSYEGLDDHCRCDQRRPQWECRPPQEGKSDVDQVDDDVIFGANRIGRCLIYVRRVHLHDSTKQYQTNRPGDTPSCRWMHFTLPCYGPQYPVAA